MDEDNPKVPPASADGDADHPAVHAEGDQPATEVLQDQEEQKERKEVLAWPAPTSQRKIEANRKNGAKGGVKTAAGKRRSRRNALRHGMRSTTLHLQDADGAEAQEFGQLRDALEAEFQPRSTAEHLLIEKIAVAVLRSRNGIKHELRELQTSAPFSYPAVDRLVRYAAAADKSFFRALQELKSMNAEEVDEGGGEEQS